MTLEDVTTQLKTVNTSINDLKVEAVDTNEYLNLTNDTIIKLFNGLKSYFEEMLDFMQGQSFKELEKTNDTIKDSFKELKETNESGEDKNTNVIKDSLTSLEDKFVQMLEFMQGNSLKDIEEKRERDAFNKQLLAALKEKPTTDENVPEPKKEEEDSNLGLLLGGLAIAVGTIKGIIEGQIKAIKLLTSTFFSVVKGFFNISKSIGRLIVAFSPKVLVDGIGKAVSTFTNTVKTLFTGLSMQFDILKTSIMDSKVLKSIGVTVKAFFKPFVDLFTMIKDSIKSVTSVGSKFAKIGETLKSFSGLVGKTLGIVSKIFFPLTVIIALWDTVKGMFEGFEKEGIIGGIKGAITGLFNSLIFGPLDMIKSAISWVLGFFGFEKMEKLLDSFSFEDMFTKIVATLFSPLQYIQDAISGAFKYIKDKFGAVLSFFGVDFGEEEQLQQEVDLAKDQERRVNTAGAVAIDPDTGDMVTQTNMVNGVFDDEAAKRALEARGLKPLSEEERINLEENLKKNRIAKEAALKEVQDSPKFTDFLPSMDDITTKLKSIGTSIWDSMTSAFDSIVEDIKAVDFSEFLGDAANMASNFFKNILKGVLPSPDAMTIELPSVDTWFGKVGGGTINLNPIPDSIYEFAGINPSTGEDIAPPSAKKSEVLTQEMEVATSEQNQIKDGGSNTTNVVDASTSSNVITNNTNNTTVVAPAPAPVRQPNSPSEMLWN